MIHRIPCNGLVHYRAYFTLTELSLEELTRAAGLTGLLGKLPTARHDALSLQQEIKRYTGSLGFSLTTRSSEGETETCTPCLVAYASALEENADKAQELLAEILTSTRFDEDQKITEIMLQTEMGVRQRIVSAGHVIGIRNALSHFSAENAVKNALEGDEMVRYIHAFAQAPERHLPLFRETMIRALETSVCRQRMTVSVTSDSGQPPERLIDALPEGTPAPAAAAYRHEGGRNIGYRIPAQVGFAVRGCRLSALGHAYSGVLWLAAGMLSLGYLWNRVRVQGGAYGAGLSVDRFGNLYTYSYRDPTPGRSLSVDEGLSGYLRTFAEGDESLDKYIISSLNELNPLLSPRERGVQADLRLMTGFTREEAERIRREILHATKEDLAACGAVLDDFVREGALCVVGPEEALSACEGLRISDL